MSDVAAPPVIAEVALPPLAQQPLADAFVGVTWWNR
jgi:hypothetical protein